MRPVTDLRLTSASRARFQAKINYNGPVAPAFGTPCHLWTGATDRKGYGVFSLNAKSVSAHRVSWVDVHGEPPAVTPCVLHGCDTPACTNVGHFFLGTIADNNADMARKGRGTRILTPEQAQAVREACLTSSQRAVAIRFGVSQPLVSQIVRGVRYPNNTSDRLAIDIS